MSDTPNATPDGDVTPTPAPEPTPEPPKPEKPAKDPHLVKAINERDRAKARARELEDKARELDEIKAAKEKADEEKERSKGELDKIVQRYERKLEKLVTERDELAGREAKRVAANRFTALADAVQSKAGIKSKTVVRGLLREAKAEHGLEIPEGVTDDDVEETIEVLKKLDPDLFAEPGADDGSPLPPGFDPTNLPSEQLTESVRKAFRSEIKNAKGNTGSKWMKMHRN